MSRHVRSADKPPAKLPGNRVRDVRKVGYSWQNEFRFALAVNTETHEHVTIKVGALNEFAFLGPLKDIIERLQIKI